MIKDIPEEIKKQLYAKAIEKINLLIDKRKHYDDRSFDWCRLYNSIPESTRNGVTIQDWEHNMFVPYTFAHVETTAPRMTASIFNDPEYIKVTAMNNAFMKHEGNINDWYMWKLEQKGWKKKMKADIKDALVFPTAWEKVLLMKETDGNIKVDVQKVDYLDLWVNFNQQTEIDECMHRIESNVARLTALQDAGVYENVEQLVPRENEYDTTTAYPLDIPEQKAKIESLYLSIADKGIDRSKESNTSRKLQLVEVMEWWTWADIGNGKPEQVIVSVGNRNVGLRIASWKEYERIPFFPLRVGKSSHTIYGRPVPQQLEMLQEELNEQRSKRYDILDRTLQLMFKARRTATIDWDTLFSAPDNVILMDDIHNDLATIDQGTVPPHSYKEEDITKSDMDFVAGGSDYRGIAKGTATGVNAVLSEDATRYRGMVDDFVEDMEALINYVFIMEKKFATENESYRIFNSQEWDTMTLDALKGDYNLKIGVSNISTPNKEVRLQLLINLLNIVGNMQGMEGVDIKEFIRRLLTQADIKNVDDIMGKGSVGKKGRTVQLRNSIADLKNQEVEGIQTGVEGVAGRIQEPLNALLPPSVTGTQPDATANPLMDILNLGKGAV
jgi:hypothetical protein